MLDVKKIAVYSEIHTKVQKRSLFILRSTQKYKKDRCLF
jgi:hypothetical protein